MAETVQVVVETSKRHVFAAAVAWPGWCRRGRDEDAALAALAEYGTRYAPIAEAAGTAFSPPGDAGALVVVERTEGDASTEFGIPGAVMDVDRLDLDEREAERQLGLLVSAWAYFDAVADRHLGGELRKGPRGGGREVEGIIEHVLGADGGYLTSLGGRWKAQDGAPVEQERARLRDSVREVWELRVAGEDPPRIPRKGVEALWPLRYYARRSAWHALDHAWEIEDRLLS